MFLAASWKNLEVLILLALNTAEGNKLSFCPLISYISQCKNGTISLIDSASAYRADWSTG